MNGLDKLQSLVDLKESYQKELQAKGEEVITDVLKELFDTYSELNSIEIAGYVPYFNDGDACVFSINEAQVTYNNQEYCESYDATWRFEEGDITLEEKEELLSIYRALQNLTTLEDAFESIFGEHFKLTATKNGVEVEEYTEHD